MLYIVGVLLQCATSAKMAPKLYALRAMYIHTPQSNDGESSKQSANSALKFSCLKQ
jgi:hypothetical protein